MKSIKQWLQELPEPYRSKALGNRKGFVVGESHEGGLYNTLYDALYSAFHWGGTSEGYDYWEEIANGKSPVILAPLAPTCAIEALMTIALKKGFDVQDIESIVFVEVPLEQWKYKLKENDEWFYINLKTATDGK